MLRALRTPRGRPLMQQRVQPSMAPLPLCSPSISGERMPHYCHCSSTALCSLLGMLEGGGLEMVMFLTEALTEGFWGRTPMSVFSLTEYDCAFCQGSAGPSCQRKY